MSTANLSIDVTSSIAIQSVRLMSDRFLAPAGGPTWVQNSRIAEALWVVEQVSPVDSLAQQEAFVRSGKPTLVCSFLRRSVGEIGSCTHFVGSTASVAAASGISVHCDHDLLRAARELRGRLSVRTLTVIRDRCFVTITSRDSELRGEVDRENLVDLLADLSAVHPGISAA